MELPACGCSMRTKSLSVAYIYLVISVMIALLPLSFSMKDYEPLFLFGYFGFLAFHTLLTVFLLVGVYKKLRPMIVMWLVYDTLMASALIVNFILAINEYLQAYSYHLDTPFITGVLINIAMLCLKLYGCRLVYYYYKEVDKEYSKLHNPL